MKSNENKISKLVSNDETDIEIKKIGLIKANHNLR